MRRGWYHKTIASTLAAVGSAATAAATATATAPAAAAAAVFSPFFYHGRQIPLVNSLLEINQAKWYHDRPY
jgi:hypothetical protein